MLRRRRLLLTPSQVSILVTTVIVILFTTALFLSGYVIQQRTLRQLRESIRAPPRPSPKLYLPDRFKTTTTELEDGTVIVLESEAERETKEQMDAAALKVAPTLRDEEEAMVEHATAEEAQVALSAEEHADGEEKTDAAAFEAPDLEGMDERERNVYLLSAKNQRNPDPAAKDQRPISRLERRRRIKEEIFKLSHDKTPVYWQRRLW